jgi:hypothetical protein
MKLIVYFIYPCLIQEKLLKIPIILYAILLAIFYLPISHSNAGRLEYGKQVYNFFVLFDMSV